MTARSVALVALCLFGLIGSAAAQQPAVPNDTAGESVRGMQQRILADPEMAAKVQALRDNPNVQALLNDPAVAAALSRGDYGALLSDPKVQRLAEDPAIRDLSGQVNQ
jgi:hypothetical protein